MTAKRKTVLAVVSQNDIIPAADAMLPIPEAPVLDEDASYVQEQQAELSKTESRIWIVENEMKATAEDYDRQVELLRAKRDATMGMLTTRYDTLNRKRSRIQAALGVGGAE